MRTASDRYYFGRPRGRSSRLRSGGAGVKGTKFFATDSQLATRDGQSRGGGHGDRPSQSLIDTCIQLYILTFIPLY